MNRSSAQRLTGDTQFPFDMEPALRDDLRDLVASQDQSASQIFRAQIRDAANGQRLALITDLQSATNRADDVQVNFKLPVALKVDLERVAREHDVSAAEFLRGRARVLVAQHKTAGPVAA